MVRVIKTFYKRSHSKMFNIGEEVSFSKADETRLVKEGLVEKIKIKK